MSANKRRDVLKASATLATGAVVGPFIWVKQAAAQWRNEPEKAAKLRVLRWKRFVQGDEDQYMANVKKFTETFGIEVRVDHEGWEDVRPKAAVAAPELCLVDAPEAAVAAPASASASASASG